MKHFLMITCVLLLAFAFGAAGLNADIVWQDEMYSLLIMGALNPPYSLQQVLDSHLQYGNDVVPLYFMLVSQWTQLVGWSQVPIRYFSLLSGALLVAVVYRFGVDAFDRRTALIAAFLLSTSAFVIPYFHEIRMYTLWLTLAVTHSWLYWRLTSGFRAGRCTWLSFTISACGMLYSHVFSVFLLCGLGAHHLLLAKKTRRWLWIVAAWGLGVLAFLPYLPVILIGFRNVTESDKVASFGLSTVELMYAAARAVVNDVFWLWLPIVAVGSITIVRRNRFASIRLLVILGFTASSIVFFNSIFPIIYVFRIRYFMILVPFLVILVAHFLRAFQRWRVVATLFIIIWVIGGYHVWQQGAEWAYSSHQTLLMKHPPLHRYSDALRDKTRAHDFMLGFARSDAINWQWKRDWTIADYYTQTVLNIGGGFINLRLTGSELLNESERKIDNQPYLLLTYNPLDKSPDVDKVIALIEADYRACKVVVNLDDILIQRYVYRTLTCDRAYQPIRYDNGITIVDKFADYDAENKSVRVVTGWEVAEEAQLEQFNVSIQIITSDWQNVRQPGDRHLYDDILKWYVVETSTDGLPPGDYRAVVILYDRYSDEKATGVDETTGEAGTILPILHFSIAD